MCPLPSPVWRQPAHKIQITHQQQENKGNNGKKQINNMSMLKSCQ